MYMATIIGSVGRVLTAANSKADQLTTLAKGALCLPSIIAGLPDLGKSLVGNVIGGVAAGINSAAGVISDMITDTVQGAIASITGAITGVVDSVVGLVAEVAGVITAVTNFISDFKDGVDDVLDFVDKKENCNFAAASLMNCVVGEALNSINVRDVKDINRGLKSVTDSVDKATSAITDIAGPLNRSVAKKAEQIDRAARIVEKANLF